MQLLVFQTFRHIILRILRSSDKTTILLGPRDTSEAVKEFDGAFWSRAAGRAMMLLQRIKRAKSPEMDKKLHDQLPVYNCALHLQSSLRAP